MDPNPYKHEAIFLAKVRDEIEPWLQAAGFQFHSRNKPDRPIFLYIDYTRNDVVFRLSWDRRNDSVFIGLTAEIIKEPDYLLTIAKINFAEIAMTTPRRAVTTAIDARIGPFVQNVQAYLGG